MACPYYQDSIQGDSLRVCGSKNRADLVPSLVHLKLFCLSFSAYRECPKYKRKASNWWIKNRWSRLFKQSVWLLFGQGK